jgi:uncharacterized protein (TIRG00374 family)
MESRAPAPKQADPKAASRRRRIRTGLTKMALGLALLAALVFWGQIDLKVLLQLIAMPSAVATCLALLFLTLPVAALRWSILLRALGVKIPFGNLLHFVAIGVFANVLLLGNAGGDAIRGIYAWRALGRSGGRVAVSLLADRSFSLLGVLLTSLFFALLDWHRLQQVPALIALSTSILVAVTVCTVGVCALFVAPGIIRQLEVRLSRRPLAVKLLMQTRDVIIMLRANPLSLLAALALALVTQFLAVFAVLSIAEALKIGALSAADYMFAVPLTVIVNSLPLTPSGIGVGEVAFDQICRWLEPIPSGAAYSSVFFAFRVVSMLICVPGLISLAHYRNVERSEPAQ